MKPEIIRAKIFDAFPEVLFGFSTKIGGISPEPYCMNLGESTGDNPENVRMNRKIFFDAMGLSQKEVSFQKQIHSAIIRYSQVPCDPLDGDGLYTDLANNFLAVNVADCIPVFFYEPEKKIAAAIHAGWKGTRGQIVKKMLEKMRSHFNIELAEIRAYIGPGISQENYEVGAEVAEHFGEEIKKKKGEKFLLDLKKENLNQLTDMGVRKENIEISSYCTFEEKDLLHSYRRDRESSGRMLGVIGFRY